MTKALRSGLINGAGASVGAYMAVATSIGDNGSVSEISSITWSIIIGTGVYSLIKDMQAQKSTPE